MGDISELQQQLDATKRSEAGLRLELDRLVTALRDSESARLRAETLQSAAKLRVSGTERSGEEREDVSTLHDADGSAQLQLLETHALKAKCAALEMAMATAASQHEESFKEAAAAAHELAAVKTAAISHAAEVERLRETVLSTRLQLDKGSEHLCELQSTVEESHRVLQLEKEKASELEHELEILKAAHSSELESLKSIHNADLLRAASAAAHATEKQCEVIFKAKVAEVESNARSEIEDAARQRSRVSVLLAEAQAQIRQLQASADDKMRLLKLEISSTVTELGAYKAALAHALGVTASEMSPASSSGRKR